MEDSRRLLQDLLVRELSTDGLSNHADHPLLPGLDEGRENLAIVVGEDDVLTTIPSRHDVVGGALVFDPLGSGHDRR